MKSPIICAEIGSNHNADLSHAQHLIEAAAKAGCDVVKFQCYLAKEFVHPVFNSNLFERILSLQFTEDQWKILADTANECGVKFFASVFGPFGIKVLKEVKASWIKIASGDFNHIHLIKQAIKANIPMILATGMSSWKEIYQVEDIFQTYPSFRQPLFLHCISKYPSTNEEASLGTLEEAEKTLRRAWGYSDHVPGIETCKKAMFAGAVFVEKHFTLTPELRTGDHPHSATPKELFELVAWRDHVLEYWPSIPQASPSKILIDLQDPAFKTVSLSLRPDLENREKWRRAIYASQNISKGKRITIEDLDFLRPSWIEGIKGMISCGQYSNVLGKITKKDFSKGEPLVWGELQGVC